MKKIFNLLLCSLLLTFVISINVNAATNDWEQDYKYYTNGIVDGGAYRLKNVETGLYMTLQNNSETDGTKIVLSNSSSSTSQMFYVNYLGDNRYTFNIYNSESLMFNISSSSNGTDLAIATKNTNVTYQRFRIYSINSSEYNICTNVSSYSSGLYASYDEVYGWHVEQKNSLNLTANQMKWTFEKVDDRARDKYTAYYLKDSSTNLYLTVTGTTSGSQLSLTKFTGGENQRFKKYLLNDGNGFGYYYVPMIKTDMAIELSTLTILDVFDQNTTQKFTESSDSAGNYKLSASVNGVTRYISKGNAYTYNGTNAYYLSTTTNSVLAVNFVFETAYNETPFIYNFNLEISIGRTLTNYSDKHLYMIKPTISGDYNFFIKRSSGNAALSVYNQNNVWMPGTVTNYTDGQRYKVTLERDKIYYIIVADYNSAGSSYTFYCQKDMIVYVHGMNTNISDNRTDADRRTDCAVPVKDLLNSYDYYDPIINNESDMTSTFVRNEDSSTGLIPLQAPIYIFRGHGCINSAGNMDGVTYCTGTSTTSGVYTWLMADDIYDISTNTVVTDMTGNSFVAWIACQTTAHTNNLANSSVLAGSLCSLGFDDDIYTNAANKFTINLFKEIEKGKTISQAVNNAHSGISFWFTGLDSAHLYGNSSIKLKPSIPTLFSQMTSKSSLNNNLMQFNRELLEGYTFMYENNSGTLKRYVKLIDGYVTDDYIDVYYENNTVTGYYMSKTKYSNVDLLRKNNFRELFETSNDYKVDNKIVVDNVIFDKLIETNVYEQIYTYDNNIIPIRFYVSKYINTEGITYLDIKIYNVQSRTLLNEEVIYQ